MFNYAKCLKVAVVVGLLGTALGVLGISAQAEEQTWLNTDLSLQKISQLASGQTVPYSINGNRDCQNHEFVTRPKVLLQTAQSHTTCGVQTMFGMADPNGWVELNGTQTSGKFINYSGYPPGFIPIPGSNRFINYTSAPQGLYLYFTDFTQNKITATQNLDRSVAYQINQPPSAVLKDKSGTLLQVQSDSLSFSSNGKWMVVDSPGRAVLRVNLQTLEVVPFAPTFNYSIGISPGLQTTITSDGRYAVIYSYSFNTFKIYDLATCGVTPNTISQPVTCQSKDLLPIPQAQISNFKAISRLRFVLNERLEFYANNYLVPGVPSTIQMAKYSLSIGDSSSFKSDYLAMGDSYISGEGAYSYITGTDTNTNHCHLSLVSYPFLVSKRLNFNSGHSVACSGAVNWDIVNNDMEYSGQDKAGVKRRSLQDGDLLRIYSEYKPGQITQLDFVGYSQPKAITISISGNDIGFSTILRRCLEPDTCYSTYEDRVELVRQINTTLPKLLNTYQAIKNTAPPGAKIYAVGYPQLAKATGDCAVNVRLNAQELDFASQLISYLDTVIKTATQKAGVGYIDTQNAFDGHKMCETKTSNVAVNGITAGSDQPDFLGGPLGNETYHPNALGHQMLADAVVGQTNGLSSAVPVVTDSTLPSEDSLGFLNAPRSGRQINLLNYDDGTSNNVVYRQGWWDFTLDSAKVYLKANVSVLSVLNSEPVQLNTLYTDQNGALVGRLYIPAETEPGYHMLHLYTQNLAGEQVDIVKMLYVAANQIDYDGDAVLNANDSCKYFPNSGIDYDKDGVDDACDGQISEPRALVEPAAAGPIDIGVESAAIEPTLRGASEPTEPGTLTIGYEPPLALGGEATNTDDSSGDNTEVLALNTKEEHKKPTTGQQNRAPSKTVAVKKTNSDIPRYGLLFLSAASALGLIISKRFI